MYQLNRDSGGGKGRRKPRSATWSIEDFADRQAQYEKMRNVRKETSQLRDRVDYLITMNDRMQKGLRFNANMELALNRRLELESQVLNDRLQWIRGHVSDGQLKITHIRSPLCSASLTTSAHGSIGHQHSLPATTRPGKDCANSSRIRRSRSCKTPRTRPRNHAVLTENGDIIETFAPVRPIHVSGSGHQLNGFGTSLAVPHSVSGTYQAEQRSSATATSINIKSADSFREACRNRPESSGRIPSQKTSDENNGNVNQQNTLPPRRLSDNQTNCHPRQRSIVSHTATDISMMSSLPSEPLALSANPTPNALPPVETVVRNRASSDKDQKSNGQPGKKTKHSCGKRCLLCVKFGLVDILRVAYLHLGRFIGKRPCIFIFISLLCTIVCATGLHRVVLSTKIKEGYTPLSARSRRETEVYQNFFSSSGQDPYTTTVLLQAKDKSRSLFDRELFDRVIEIEQYLTYRLQTQYADKNYSFSQFCIKNPNNRSECAMNMVVGKVYRAMHINKPDKYVRLSYPMSQFDSEQELNIANNFYNVKQLPDNSTEWNRLTDCSLVVLYFQAFIPKGQDWKAAETWEMEVYKWAYEGAGKDDDLLQVLTTGDKMIITEMHRAGFSMARFFVAGFALMIIFVFGSVFVVTLYHKALRCTQVLVAITALLAPMLSFFTTFGIIAWTGMEFYPMMVLAPYLILAIGVDNAFLMIHAWHRLHLKEPIQDPILRSAERLGRVLEEVGPSITVTSATNALAFMIGATTDTPVIRSFCLATGIAMVLCFIYELTFFGATLAWVGRADSMPEHDVHTQDETQQKLTPREKGEEDEPVKPGCCKRCSSGFVSMYARFISSWPAIIMVLIMCCFMWAFALYGAVHIKTLVSIDKILPKDTSLLKAYDQFDLVVWKEFYPVNIIVNRAPKLPNNKAYNEFNAFRKLYESGDGALGPQYSRMWLDFYVKFKEKMASMDIFGLGLDYGDDEPEPLSYDDVEFFLDNMQMWKNFVHMNDRKTSVDSFLFIVAFKEADNWDTRVEYMQRWRHIADTHPQFDVTVWSPNGLNCDAILNLKAITRETVIITLIVMVLICLMFIPSLCGVFAAALAITSTTISWSHASTVMGSLSWWSIDLDPMSVAAVLMAIGFSVDFTAHTSYHYQKAIFDNEPGCETAAGRITYTLESVGFPMFQAGFSTLLCVVPLAFHGDYAPEVLFKAITVLVFWGLLHGLVILPALLAALPSCAVSRNDEDDDHLITHDQVHEIQCLTDKV